MDEVILKEFKGLKVVQGQTGEITITIHKPTLLEEIANTDDRQYCLILTAEKRRFHDPKYSHALPTARLKRSHTQTVPISTNDDIVDNW